MKTRLDILNEVVQFSYWPEFFVRNLSNSDIQEMIVNEVKSNYAEIKEEIERLKKIEDDCISADDARFISNNIRNEKWERQLFMIMRDIKETASKGGNETSVNDISPVVSKKLEELGYTVRYFAGNEDPRESSYYTINWAK